MLFRRRSDALRGNPFDRRVVYVDQPDIRAIVSFEIAALERQPTETETVVFRDQLLCDRRVVDPFPDLTRHEFGCQRIGLLVRQDVPIVADPDAEARLGIQFLPESLPLFRRGIERATGIRRVDEASNRLPATGIYLVVARFDVLLFFRGNLRVVQWCCPIGMALENRQLLGCLGYFRDRLNRRCPRADNANPLAFERHGFVRPAGGVEGLPLEVIASRNVRERRGREHTETGDQQRSSRPAAVFESDGPVVGRIVELSGGHPRVEGHIAAEVVLIGDNI